MGCIVSPETHRADGGYLRSGQAQSFGFVFRNRRDAKVL
jgi:hypothetical protein